jgi:hypothetical protein
MKRMMCLGVRNWPLMPAVVYPVDRRDQQARVQDHQLGVLHVFGEGRRAVELAEVGEDLVAYHAEHLDGVSVLEVAPAQVLLVVGEDALVGLPGPGRLLLASDLGHVEQAGEHQERDLLDDGEGVGDPARPELGPQGVDLALLRGAEGAHEARLLAGGSSGAAALG